MSTQPPCSSFPPPTLPLPFLFSPFFLSIGFFLPSLATIYRNKVQYKREKARGWLFLLSLPWLIVIAIGTRNTPSSSFFLPLLFLSPHSHAPFGVA